jgi:NAD(P)-dependent dehydrogenase (short-subunit alcohol dehydrogenase family)
MGEPQRIAIVTGAAAGIGRALACRLAADGAQLVLADIVLADETAGSIEEAGGTALAVECDVSDPESVERLRATVEPRGPAAILVHNAAVYPMGGLAEASFETWRRVMAVNLDSMFLLCKAFVPGMVVAGWGRVIGIATGMFHDGAPGALAYVASKGGVVGVVRSLAAEIGAHGVTVNAVSPGLTRTPGTERAGVEELGLFDYLAQAQAIKRNGAPGDISGAVSFLASDDASWITGQTLLVDGGKANL